MNGGVSQRSSVPMRAWICMLVALVVLTTLYVWKKVELMRVSGQVNALKVQAEDLREEQSRLTATLDLKKRPGAIVDAAQEKLGMIYHPGNAPELIVGTAAREVQR